MSQESLQEYLHHPCRHHLEQVVREYYQFVWQVAFRVSRHEEDAADICQDLFLKLLLKPPPPERVTSPKVYFCWLVLSRHSHLRTAAKRRLAREAQSVGRRGESGLAGEDLDLLHQTISRLPESLRVPIECSYLLGFGTREIAELLGITDQAVRQRLEKGRELLRRRLAPLGATLALAAPSVEGAVPPPVPPRLLAELLQITEAGGALAAPATAIAGSITWFEAGVLAMSAKKLALVCLALLLLLGTGVTVFLLDPAERGAGKPQPPLPAPGGTATARAAPPESLRASAKRADAVSQAEEVGAGAGVVSLLGVIRDGAGQGVAQARVLAIPLETWSGVTRAVEREALPFQNDYSRDLPRIRESYLRLAERVPRTSSDDRGGYRFKDLAAGEYRLLVEHAGFLPPEDVVVLVEGSTPARCDIDLQPGQVIAGKVVDASGNPLPGAEVSAEPWATAVSRGAERVRDLLEAWELGRLLLDQGKAVTGPDGTFGLRSLEPGYYLLLARREGYLEGTFSNVPGGARDITLTLTRGAQLVGRILDPASAPVAQARIRLSPVRSAEVHRLFDRNQEDIDILGARSREVSSGEDGRFEVDGAGEGAHELLVDAPGFAPLRSELTVRGALVEVGDLVLEKPLSIAGVVLGPGQAPVDGARVWIEQPFSRASPYSYLVVPDENEPLAETRTGADGRFALDGLPPGVFDVKAASEGLSIGLAQHVRSGGREVTMVLGSGFTLKGTVVDLDSSQPVPGVDLRIGLRGELRGVTDANGVFEIGNVPPPALTESTAIQAYHPDYGIYLETRVSLFGRDERSPLHLRLPRSGLLRGWVSDSQGKPVARARVFLEIGGVDARDLGQDLSSGRRPLTADDGSFSMPVPAALRYPREESLYVIASHPDHGTGRAGPLAMPATRERWPEVRIALEPGATVRGEVRGAEGQPIASARIRIRRISSPRRRAAHGPESAGTARSAYSGADGSFSMKGVEIGHSEIGVSAVGHASWHAELEVEPDAMLQVVLQRGGAVAGRVADSQGQPLGGAEVAALLERPEESAPEVSDFGKRMRLLRSPGVLSVRTEADGRYRLENLPEGTFTVVARAEGHEPAMVSAVRAGDKPKDLVLTRFSAIVGTVRAADSMEAVTDFAVDVLDRAKLEARGRRQHHLASEGRLNFHDPAGRFVYDGLRPGEYTLLVHAPGFLFRLVEVSLRSGDEQVVEVLLEDAGRLEGIVLDAESGEAVPGAVLSCRNLTNRALIEPPGSGSTRAREDGTFTLSGLVNGVYGVRAEHPLYKSGKVFPIDVSEGRETPRVEFKLTPAGRVEGRVKGYLGDRMSCRVVLKKLEEKGRPPGSEPSYQTHVEPEGYYLINSVERGVYQVELKKHAIVLGRTEHYGPTGASQATKPAGPEEVTVLGEVVVSEGRTAVFDFTVP